jgi:dihydroorotase
MKGSTGVTVLRNAHVIDPARGIDWVTDVTLENGTIGQVGDSIATPAGAETIDLAGHYLTPGWIDLHVHSFGTLGFGDPDSIGIYQGVTSLVDAGGPGITTLDEFVALSRDRMITDVYAGPYIFPLGIIGFDYVESADDIRSLSDHGIEPWLDWAAAHPGTLRYIKAGAYSPQGRVPIDIAKRVAERLGIPLYIHIGELQETPGVASPAEDAFRIAQAGDIVTHIYHNYLGRILDDQGRILPAVRDAAQRGVLFDLGFGNYGFSWDVAEKAYAQGLLPHFISSDLQQFNVLGPVCSLANVMSVCLRLGLSLRDVIARVTENPARALSLGDRAGSLRVGAPADVTVFRLESGAYELSDCFMQKRMAETRILPVMAFKDGRRVDCDLARAQDERNWFMQIAEDQPPAPAGRLSARQSDFLASLAAALRPVAWEVRPPRELDLRKATALQALFHDVRRAHALPLAEAMGALYDCFLETPFPMQIGLFLVRLDRSFVLDRLAAVTAQRSMAAAE